MLTIGAREICALEAARSEVHAEELGVRRHRALEIFVNGFTICVIARVVVWAMMAWPRATEQSLTAKNSFR